MAKFEGQERRMPGINACLKEYGMNTLEDARDLTLEHGINVEEIVKGVQPIAFDNAVWAYTLGTALALKKGRQERGGSQRDDRCGTAGLLRARFRCRAAPGGPGPRQPGCYAAAR